MRAPVSLAELSVQLKLAALREACGVEALEVLAARSPDERVFAASLREARLSAELMGDAYRLLKALIPYEEAVRELLGEEDASQTSHPAAPQPPSPTRGEGESAAA